MSNQFLSMMRSLNRIIHNLEAADGEMLLELSREASRQSGADIVFVSKDGSIDALSAGQEQPLELSAGAELAGRFRNVYEIKEYDGLTGFPLKEGVTEEDAARYRTLALPVMCGGGVLGSLFIYRKDEVFTEDEHGLADYFVTLFALIVNQRQNEESAEKERGLAVVRSAVSTLSYSEYEAIAHIFDELGGREGLLVASKIADRVGITRSVIVNALRKFESAGVIETRSLGMKGTFIKVLNPYLVDELKKAR